MPLSQCSLNNPNAMKRKKPIRRVSKKRAKANAEYLKRREVYLKAHPNCQFHLAEWCLDEDQVSLMDGLVLDPAHQLFGRYVPRATEIHHKRGRFGSRLCDEQYWMAVSQAGHDWIHKNPKEAYARGYMIPR